MRIFRDARRTVRVRHDELLSAILLLWLLPAALAALVATFRQTCCQSTGNWQQQSFPSLCPARAPTTKLVQRATTLHQSKLTKAFGHQERERERVPKSMQEKKIVAKRASTPLGNESGRPWSSNQSDGKHCTDKLWLKVYIKQDWSIKFAQITPDLKINKSFSKSCITFWLLELSPDALSAAFEVNYWLKVASGCYLRQQLIGQLPHSHSLTLLREKLFTTKLTGSLQLTNARWRQRRKKR